MNDTIAIVVVMSPFFVVIGWMLITSVLGGNPLTRTGRAEIRRRRRLQARAAELIDRGHDPYRALVMAEREAEREAAEAMQALRDVGLES